jgi:hypothetical protein
LLNVDIFAQTNIFFEFFQNQNYLENSLVFRVFFKFFLKHRNENHREKTREKINIRKLVFGLVNVKLLSPGLLALDVLNETPDARKIEIPKFYIVTICVKTKRNSVESKNHRFFFCFLNQNIVWLHVVVLEIRVVLVD